VYYPDNADINGICEVLESRMDRLDTEIFGDERTFRDSETCRDVVYEYLCLFWASDSIMYKNDCQDRFLMNLFLKMYKNNCQDRFYKFFF